MGYKTVLIPFDFNHQSLNFIHSCLTQIDESVKIRLVFSSQTEESIFSLLFESKSRRIRKYLDQEFREELDIIKNVHENKIQDFTVDVFRGWNRAALANFCEGNKVDMIMLPTGTLSTSAQHRWLIKNLRKTALPIQLIETIQRTGVFQQSTSKIDGEHQSADKVEVTR